MAADLHIHIFEGITEQDLADFNASHFGSRFFNLARAAQIQRDMDLSARVYSKISNTPNVWVGEVSWLKAAVFEDVESFVPAAIRGIYDIIGEDLPEIDDTLIDRVKACMGLSNKTGYDLTDAGKMIVFLEEHKGKRVFTVSW